MSLYLDEDVDVLVATLRARGFDVVTTVASGNLAHSDEDQLKFATTAGRVLLTHNRVDFERIADNWRTLGTSHAGVVIAVRRPAYELTRRLLLILNDVSREDAEDQLLYG